MHYLKKSFFVLAVVLVAACSKKEVVVTPPPAPVYKPLPLIAVESATPLRKQSHSKQIGANISFSNISASTYQYILFKTTAYDKDGKVVPARKSRDSSAYLRVAGPIKPGQVSAGNAWQNTWNSKNVHCLAVDKVEIIFSDGSIEVAEGETLIEKKHTCIN